MEMELSRMPDLVVYKILQLIPTKAVIHASFLSKQWEGVWASSAVLNFDEDDDFERHDLNCYADYLHQHKRFVNFLQGCLECCRKCPRKSVPDKLRIDMRMYLCEEATMIDKWLELAFEIGVKELDIRPKPSMDPKQNGILSGPRSQRPLPDPKIHRSYCLPWSALANAKSLTSLNLEFVKVTNFERAYIRSDRDHDRLLPSMKNMYFTNVWFADKALLSLLSECPSLDHFSMLACSFENVECRVSSSSLKSLEIKSCFTLKILQVDDVTQSLESFTFVTPHFITRRLEKVVLNSSFNLKRIHICANNLEELVLIGCHRALEATIDIKNLHRFDSMVI